MTDDYTTLEQSKRLKALGMSQAEDTVAYRYRQYRSHVAPPFQPTRKPKYNESWVAVPLLRALDWLEERAMQRGEGWLVERRWSPAIVDGRNTITLQWVGTPIGENWSQPLVANSASALIDAILDKLEDRND